MCGITGYININSKPIANTSGIIKMLDIQKHRGPDDSGIRMFSLESGMSKEVNVKDTERLTSRFEGVLGFNRLSILDLSSNGHQPMMSPDEKVILTLNGEIYNAFDYKQELEDWGYRFKSKTDTEVVLALYLKYGFEGMLEKLNGMFAIVIADLSERSLKISRDRFGIKPMYFINTPETLAFSSELKSFRYLDGFRFNLAEEKIDEYLLFRNSLNGTLYKGIDILKPGSYLIYNSDSGVTVKEFFNINEYSRSLINGGGIDFYKGELEKWLGQSVGSQLMSDVKLGCQLSGGVDSSLVAWQANRISNHNFESVSIIFDNKHYSEEKYIDAVRDKLNIPAHKFSLDANYFQEHFESATWHLEAPLNHPNTVGIYKLSQCAKEHVTVLLSGEGADEVFGGYSRFYNLGFPFNRSKILHEIKKNMKSPQEYFWYLNPELRSIMATAFMTPLMAKDLLTSFNRKEAVKDRMLLYRSLSGSQFDKQIKYEINTFLPDLLIRQDKMSMAHSIENRVPFLDNELVKNSFSIPEKYLLQRRSRENINPEKYLLKSIGEKVFGEEFAFRNKMGFGIPLRDFFQNSRFIEYLSDKILPGIKNRGIFNSRLASVWLNNIGRLKYYELEALWIILAFETWASVYFENLHESSNTGY